MARSTDGRKLRVVVLGLNYAPETTGIAPYTTGFARHLAGLDHDVTVITGQPHYPEWKSRPDYEPVPTTREDHGVRLVRVPHPVPNNPIGLPRLWMELVFAWRAGGQLLRRRPDVVVAVSPALMTLLPAALLRPLLRYRVGAWVQDLYGAALAETGIGRGFLARAAAQVEFALLRRMDGIVVIHDVFLRSLVAGGIAEDRIEVVPNWAHVIMPEAVDRAAVRQRLGWRDDAFIALHAGNMGVKQGLDGLVDVARLADERGSAARIVLMGNGSQKSTLAEQARGVKRIHLLESLPHGEFEAALTAADCLLLHEKPGVVEMSVPSKLTTYFAAGRPVVAATDPRSGASALMQAANAGVVVRAGDATRILDAIEGLARCPEKAQAFGRKGKQYATEHLSVGASLGQKVAWVRRLAYD